MDLGCPPRLQAALRPSAPVGVRGPGLPPPTGSPAPLRSRGWGLARTSVTLQVPPPTRSSVQRLLTWVSSVSMLGFLSPRETKRGAPLPWCCWEEESSPSVKCWVRPTRRAWKMRVCSPLQRVERPRSGAPSGRRPRKEPQAGVRAAAATPPGFPQPGAHRPPNPVPLRFCVPALTLAPQPPSAHMGSVCSMLGVRHTSLQMHD